ncbi:MAG: hypothetical protein DRH07_06270 [Deltaproteobacteria bacterium]|nr:MAG: hypothetical protein DRH07_06270 [Deltaproteobacteria bacterium]
MKNTLRIITLIAILHASFALAADGGSGGGISLIGWIFIGFMAVVITFQFMPSLMMFGGMMMSIFGKEKNRKRVVNNGKSGNS